MNPKGREEFRRQKQIRIRLARASFRPEMAELERIWAIVSAHREGLSVRDIARQVGLGPTRVHQLVGYFAQRIEKVKLAHSGVPCSLAPLLSKSDLSLLR